MTGVKKCREMSRIDTIGPEPFRQWMIDGGRRQQALTERRSLADDVSDYRIEAALICVLNIKVIRMTGQVRDTPRATWWTNPGKISNRFGFG